jgi:methionyl-tRNA synthetase
MNAVRLYISTTIPYVNARAHLGHALELVQADVLARHHRQAGDEVRFQTGTDDNSLKNVLAAQDEGVAVRELVDRNARAFAALRDPLGLSFDDFIATSSDPRHLPGVDRLWRACAASGDLYARHYEGLYCVGCEQFYKPAELPGGRCPEHDAPPQLVTEENWFFRLSRYADQLHDLISSDQLRISPAGRRNEVLAFIASGLEDFSASRSAERAGGWGIGVPDDPSQVIYVWWDALGNYITALGYGTGDPGYQHWWAGADRRIHLVGKGVLRFHAVYWPAILLSAGEPLPTQILVHDYLTIDGHKISKSKARTGAGAGVRAGDRNGNGGGGRDGDGDPARADPVALAAAFGTDAVRWWLLREVPRVGDADFTIARLISRANDDLANELGNLVNRTISLVHRYRDGRVPQALPAGGAEAGPGPAGPGPAGHVPAGPLLTACEQAPQRRAAALEAVDFRAATAAVWQIVTEANRCIERIRPWELARAERDGEPGAAEQLDSLLSLLVGACRTLGREIEPFVPGLAARIIQACDDSAGSLPPPRPVFPRIG